MPPRARGRAASLVCLAAAGGLLVACDGQNNQVVGTGAGAVLGGVAGALIGRQVGGGPTGAIVGGLLGAGAGALAGNYIAQRLSERERERAASSTSRVLDGPARPGARDEWRSPDTPGNRGASELVRVTDGGTCRMVREIAYVRGEELQEETRYCRGSDGRWARAA